MDDTGTYISEYLCNVDSKNTVDLGMHIGTAVVVVVDLIKQLQSIRSQALK
jgi:hypothetical protein